MPQGDGGAQWDGANFTRTYRLRWDGGADTGWDSDELARALLVDCFEIDAYRTRVDLHRALAAEVLARLPRERWVLTTTELVDWLVEAHIAAIRRKRVGLAAAEEELAVPALGARRSHQGRAIEATARTRAGVRRG